MLVRKATVSTSNVAGTSYEWCRSKSRIRNLQNFIKRVDESFGLVD